MEILLLLAIGAGVWLLWKSSRGEDPTASGIGRLISGCLGLGCLATLLLFVAFVVVAWLLLQALADIDLSLNEWNDGGDSQGPSERPRQVT